MRFSFPWDTNNLNDDNKYVKKHEKFATFSKNAEIYCQKVENRSITTRKCAVNYHQTLYQTLDEFS